MSEDKCNDLNRVNGKFTKEVLTDILSKAYNGKKIELIHWKFNEGFAKGDSYMSTVHKGQVYGVVDDKSRLHVQVNFVIKSIPKNIGRRNTFRSVELFYNEITFYTQIVPKFETFLADKGHSKLLHIPRHFVSFRDGENDFLVLEDVSTLGFGPVSRQNCLDWTECRVILKTLAKFHAISFAYKDQKQEEFKNMISCLKETYFSSDNWGWYRSFHKRLVDIAKYALALEYPNSEAEKRFNSYKFGALFEKCIEFCNKKDAPTSVISEGDCWPPNFLIRNIGENQKEALILDFQLARCVSPVLDLSFLIYSCSLKPFRDQYFDNILKTYHSDLSSTIKLLGSDPEKIYPWDLFMKEVKEYFIFGVIFSLEAIPFCLLDTDQSFDLDLIKGNEPVDIADVFKLSNIETTSGRQRLADVIVHAFEHGYL